MKLSFVIPAHNEEKFIGKCLDSILREAAEHVGDVEIIVVDNASTDGTSSVVRTYEDKGVHVVSEPRKGLVYARQCGYEKATGDLIANVDADTMLTLGWINTVMREFTNDDKLLALSGPFIYYDLTPARRLLVRLFYYAAYGTYVLNRHIFHHGSMLQGGNFIIRKTALDQVGGFDISIDFYGEDTDIACRIAKIGKTKFTFNLPMYTSGRRLSGEGMVTMGIRYALNHFWVIFFKKPFTKESRDIRP